MIATEKDFFNTYAEKWDNEETVTPEKYRRIIEEAGISKGQRILDVGTGTGVLIPYLLEATEDDVEIFAVDYAGQPCDYRRLREIAEQHDLFLVDDACHALGGKYFDRPVGTLADLNTFSFHPVKIITTGEGGMAMTNDAALAERMALLRSHGITREPDWMTQASDGPWYYQQIALGYNYRMTEMQAALGLSQMGRLDGYVERRNRLARRYDELLATLPVITPWQHPDAVSSRHLYVIRLRLEVLVLNHRQVFEAMRESGIGVNLHYIPVHLQPWYRRMGFLAGQFPEAESYYAEAISLPLYPAMTDAQQDTVIAALTGALAAAAA